MSIVHKKITKSNDIKEIISFDTTEEWRHWLEKNHNTSKGVWLKFYKKGSYVSAINYLTALDEALCFGWIDGQAQKYDTISYLQKFTPRRSRSIWSKRNIEHVARLMQEGRMHSSGLKEIEAAKADGRWENAYDSPKNMKMPEDFLLKLSEDKKAVAFFETLNKTNRYAIAWRLQTAKKAETREKRMRTIIDMLAREEKFH